MPLGAKKTEDVNAKLYVTIHTEDGRYGERLTSDNSNNFPIQKKPNRARYSIAKQTYVMRNLPKSYAAEKLHGRQVLMFDIRNPDSKQTTVEPKTRKPRTC